MLISSFHLLLHKHCQQRRISGRTAAKRRRKKKLKEGEQDGVPKPPSPKSSCTGEEFLGEAGGVAVALKEQTGGDVFLFFPSPKVSLPKQFEHVTWCSFIGRKTEKLEPRRSWVFFTCSGVSFELVVFLVCLFVW